jgi:phosphoribosylanthranilate isomerase
MNTVIKICGMRESENIQRAAELMPDILGFIFYPKSPRFAGETLNPEIVSQLPHNIKKAGVFVNADFNEIRQKIDKYSLNIVQLHGDEPPDLCFRLKDTGIQVIKVFRISEDAGFRSCIEFIAGTDYFLFDTMAINWGGSGKKFNWKKLDNYDLRHPFIISGGISPLDVLKIKAISNPSFYGVDLNSRFEIEPGLKDIEKLKKFMAGLRLNH